MLGEPQAGESPDGDAVEARFLGSGAREALAVLQCRRVLQARRGLGCCEMVE